MHSCYQDTGCSSSQQQVVGKQPTKLRHCCRMAGNLDNIAADNSYVALPVQPNNCCYVNVSYK